MIVFLFFFFLLEKKYPTFFRLENPQALSNSRFLDVPLYVKVGMRGKNIGYFFDFPISEYIEVDLISFVDF